MTVYLPVRHSHCTKVKYTESNMLEKYVFGDEFPEALYSL